MKEKKDIYKPFFVATHSAYNVIIMAMDEQDAERKANLYYLSEYDEMRDDFTAYPLYEFLKEENEFLAFPVLGWDSWEYAVSQGASLT